MIKKIVFLIIFSFFLTACETEKPQIFFSKSPFKKEAPFIPANVFTVGEKIHFAGYNPNDFKTRLVKLQIFKKESEKSEFWGYEYLYNRTIELNNKKYFTDYITINNEGFYIFQVFEYTDLSEPVIVGVIKVVGK